jgi:hypothetical protein
MIVACSMVERRKGGESGVKSVQYLAGQAVWEARDAGLWSQELAEAAVLAQQGHSIMQSLFCCTSIQLR